MTARLFLRRIPCPRLLGLLSSSLCCQFSSISLGVVSARPLLTTVSVKTCLRLPQTLAEADCQVLGRSQGPRPPEKLFLTLSRVTLPPGPHLLCVPRPSSHLVTYPAPGPLCLNRLAYLGRWEELCWGVRRKPHALLPVPALEMLDEGPAPSSSFCRDPGILLAPAFQPMNCQGYQALLCPAPLAGRYHQAPISQVRNVIWASFRVAP